MKQMRRIIFNGLSVFVLLLFVATASKWVRSHWVADSIGYTRGTFCHLNAGAISQAGAITVWWHRRMVTSGVSSGGYGDDERDGTPEKLAEIEKYRALQREEMRRQEAACAADYSRPGLFQYDASDAVDPLPPEMPPATT